MISKAQLDASRFFWIPLHLCLLLLCIHSQAQGALQSTSAILVLPFGINAEPELDYLREDLPELLRDQLQERGFRTIDGQTTNAVLREEGVSVLDLRTARDLGMLTGADYTVYGTLNQVGETLSLDVRLVDPDATKPAKAIYVSKQGLINVLPALQELADSIADQIQEKETIQEIEVTGNEVLDEDVVLMRLKIQTGDRFDPGALDEELRRLYRTGYFEDVKLYAQDTREGKKLIVEVEEKPLIKGIEVRGEDAIDEDDILEAMSTKSGSVLNPKVISDDLAKIREVYRKDGYYQAQASYEQEALSPGAAKLIIKIDEGRKLYIENIAINGAKQLAPGELKDQLALSERGLFSWLTGGGVLKEELLNRDAAALEAYYANRGFMDARVGQPEVGFKEDGIHITFNVSEGPRYTVGSVSFAGDLITDQESMALVTSMDDLAGEQGFFDRSVLREDTQQLTSFYNNYGYAFADAGADLNKDAEENQIHITYRLTKKHKVFVRRVTISGNHKTRDNVIRRQLRLTGGELFSGARLAVSKQRLQRLDYFETVEIETQPTEEPDQMDLKVRVKEKSTGSFSAGAGFSTIDNVFFTAQVQERNVLGKGYSASFRGSFSSISSRFQLSFWNPHFKDGPLGLGVDAYSTTREYDDYDLDSTGGKFKFAYTLGDYTRLFLNYRLEQYTLDDIDNDASEQIKDIEGDNVASSVYAAITRDTTNKRLNPTRGTKNTISAEFAGNVLGGDDDFIKAQYEFSYFRPIFWKLVFNWHWKIGHLFENTGEPVPDFERFYLGGINTVRGYDYRDISATDENGDDIGGYKTFFTNVEATFPIKEDMGLLGVIFFDAGDVWDENEDYDTDLYKSVGAGIRWNSPLGPLRLEYGYPLDDLKGNDGKFEFSVGQFF